MLEFRIIMGYGIAQGLFFPCMIYIAYRFPPEASPQASWGNGLSL
jgi:hypothetical protein